MKDAGSSNCAKTSLSILRSGLPFIFALCASTFTEVKLIIAEIQTVEIVDLNNVTHRKEVFLEENNTLFEDVKLLDLAYNKLINHQKDMPTEAEKLKFMPSSQADYLQTHLKVVLVGDHSFYEAFLALQNSDEYSAFHSAHSYLNGIFVQLKRIFDQMLFFNNSLRIRLDLAKALLIVKAHDCPLRGPIIFGEAVYEDEEYEGIDLESFPDISFPNITNIDGSQNFSDFRRNWSQVEALIAVHRIRDWADIYDDLLPEHHHIIVVTRLDLLSPQNNDSSTQGMSYVGAMCREFDSVSVVEDVGGLATSVIAAHEMIHSLGAFHDGSGGNQNCSAKDNYLMAPTTSSGIESSDKFSNMFLLSDCSRKQVEKFLNSSDSDCFKFSALADGLKESEKSNDQFIRQKMPGELFDMNKQCKIAFGFHYGFCKPVDTCARLWCKNRKLRHSASCETKTFLPLMDGTMCGQDQDKWCISGECVKNPDFKASQAASKY